MDGGARIGASLRTLRESAGMTQDELAVAVGVGAGHLHAIERGEVMPSAAFLATAAGALAQRIRETGVDGGP